MPILTIAANAVVAKIMEDDTSAKDVATKALSYFVEGREHMTAFKSGGWDGTSSFFSRRMRTFPAGFLHLMQGELTKAGYVVRIVSKPASTPLGEENPIVDEFGIDDPRYDYQLKALRQVEKHGRGIIQVATGGGKTKIAKLVISRYRRMTLFLTTRGVLMYQMKDALEDGCGFKVGVIGDGVWKPVNGVNVGMVQTLIAQLAEPSLDAERRDVVKSASKKGTVMTPAEVGVLAEARFKEKDKIRNRIIKLLELVEVVIGEEAHEAGGNSYYEILKWCKNAHIRVALTATPFMRAAAEDNMRLMAAFGPILIKVSEKLLIDRGILARPYFLFAKPMPAPKLRKTSPWERAYKLEVMEGPGRNAKIISTARRAAGLGLSTLVLVQRKDHGHMLRDALRAQGVSVEFIQGKDDQPERQRALKALAAGKIQVLIGTTILDVGVDVPAIGLVILAGGGKAEVGHRQRIGRGLRAKKTGPNVAFILDFSDELNMTLREHATMRRAIVEGTPGFAENVLTAADFPWHLFDDTSAHKRV
jgi:superfamily II DNA or RNA helicase